MLFEWILKPLSPNLTIPHSMIYTFSSIKYANISTIIIMLLNVFPKIWLRMKDQYAGVTYTSKLYENFFFRKCRKFVILTGTLSHTKLTISCKQQQIYSKLYIYKCFKHMELLLRAIFIILVERWQICDYLPNPYPKCSQFIAVRYKQFYP